MIYVQSSTSVEMIACLFLAETAGPVFRAETLLFLIVGVLTGLERVLRHFSTNQAAGTFRHNLLI